MTAMVDIDVSVLIPCFNEEDNVWPIFKAVRDQLELHGVSRYEIIFIDNASVDATRTRLEEICASDPSAKAIFNTRNFGQLRSPTHGLYQCTGRAVIGMCADFQDPPEMIGALLAAWRSGSEITLCQRRVEKATFGKRISRAIGYRLLGGIGDVAILPGVTGFGIFDQRVISLLKTWNEPEPFFRGMLVESGVRISLLPVDRPARRSGKSKNDFRALQEFAFSGLASSAKTLLRLPIMTSIWMSLIGVVLIVLGLWAAVAGTQYGPTIVLAGFQVLLTSLIMFFVGLIGEQLRIVSERSRNIPLVVEERRLNFLPIKTNANGGHTGDV